MTVEIEPGFFFDAVGIKMIPEDKWIQFSQIIVINVGCHGAGFPTVADFIDRSCRFHDRTTEICTAGE
ncbi:hypothetical protein PSSHI_04560 [Photobacterium sp. R1]